MNDKTLLPCPFCSRSAKLIYIMQAWSASCECGAGIDEFDTEAEAIAAWDNRAPQATRIEALEAALRRIKDATANEMRAGDKGYVSRYGIHGIATKALENSDER